MPALIHALLPPWRVEFARMDRPRPLARATEALRPSPDLQSARRTSAARWELYGWAKLYHDPMVIRIDPDRLARDGISAFEVGGIW